MRDQRDKWVIIGIVWLVTPWIAGCGGGVWHYSLDAGMREAQQTNKRLLVQFYRMNEACLEMDQKVFTNENVKQLLDDYFVKVRLDIITNQATARQYGITEYPSFIVFRPDGSIAGTRAGASNADAFRVFLIKTVYE
jgi:hypothetical protein